jgi:hypothetical protein
MSLFLGTHDEGPVGVTLVFPLAGSDVRPLRCWHDERRTTTAILLDAPDEPAVHAFRRRQGIVAREITELHAPLERLLTARARSVLDDEAGVAREPETFATVI